jgi:hypothetical protein
LRLWAHAIANVVLASAAFAADSQFNHDAQTTAHSGAEVRRVWILSDPGGYSAATGRREIMIYDLVCEQGKMTKVSEGFEAKSGPKFGQGYVVRTPHALTAQAERRQLERVFADVCGI